MKQALVGVLVLSILLAGCASKAAGVPGGATPSDAMPVAPPPAVTDTTGSLTGRVVDEELQPVVGATVGLREIPMTATQTDAEGAFTFNQLDPGTFSLVVHDARYVDHAQRVEIQAGLVAEAIITLKALPSTIPYHEGWEHAGYMELGIGTPVISPRPSTPGGSTWGGRHDILPGINMTVSTHVWKSSAAFSASQFRLVIDTNNNEKYDKPSPSPHIVRLQAYDDIDKPGFVRHDVLVPVTCGCATNPPNGIVDPVYAQRFTIYVTAFYFEPAPDGFTNAPDA